MISPLVVYLLIRSTSRAHRCLSAFRSALFLSTISSAVSTGVVEELPFFDTPNPAGMMLSISEVNMSLYASKSGGVAVDMVGQD